MVVYVGVTIMKNKKILLFALVSVLIISVLSSCGRADITHESDSYISSFTVSGNDSSESIKTEGMLEVCFLDVGQGDCILITTHMGANILIDSGTLSSKKIVMDFLDKRGVTELEYVFLTHPHADHIGAADEIIKNISVKNLYMTNAVTTTQVYNRLLDALEEKTDINVVQAMAGQRIIHYGLLFEILSPKRDSYTSLNHYSIVIKMTYGDKSFLFTGDAEDINEQEMLDAGDNLDADVLKVGHHGSVSSTLSEFLSAVSPEIAVICCGANNSYGHPHKETTDKLADITTFRTDLNGTISVFCNGYELFVTASR
ncbi:MAG: hypothetical protein CVU97_01165 [Firmicutes bacterium HGW-Firmicutes-21]|nr:MAG: hypothetical protein CVU97_01165 [Firmicutes bacterium HGW-Firmicutes-21]